VSVHGLPGFERLAEIEVGAGPRALCAGDNGRAVYVACSGESLVCAIDAAGDSVRARIRVGNTPHHLVWDPVGNKLYCGNYGGASVSVVDCSGDTELVRVPVGRACRRLEYSPLSRKVYAACHDGRCIDVINCATDSVVVSVATSGNPWTVVCDLADNLVYPGTSWGAPVICGWGDTVVAELSDPFYIKGIAWEPRSNTVYMARNFSSDVLVIDGAQRQVRRTLSTDDYPADMVCLDSSGRAYVCHNRSGRVTGRVTVIDGDSLVTAMDVRPSPVDVVADNAGRRACVLSWESSCITLINDSPVGVGETERSTLRTRKPGTTHVRNVLFLPVSPLPLRSSLFDLSGRPVMSLVPGPNDVRHLPAGVYFVSGRMANGEWRVANRVVIVSPGRT
jgi:DNA-binding beta-propeller fold protein YncE